jgi:starvation-inducible DNA-binding protein
MDGEIWQWDAEHSTGLFVSHMALQIEEQNHVCNALTTLLGNLFALYVKTKVCHWHAAGLDVRSRHLLLSEQADQILATSDAIGERVRALGGSPIGSIGEVGRLHRMNCSAPAELGTSEMLAALLRDNRQIAKQMRRTCALCKAHGDFASTKLLEGGSDEAEGRYWFLLEIRRDN